MIEGNDLNDNAILTATRVNIDGSTGKRQFEIILPDGFKVTSDWLPPESADRFVVKWCDSVRSMFEQRLEEASLARRHRSAPATGAPPTPGSTPASPPDAPVADTAAPSKPEDYVLIQLEKRQRYVAALQETIQRWSHDLVEGMNDLEKWERVADSLGLRKGEETTHDETDRDGKRGSADSDLRDLFAVGDHDGGAGGSGSEDRDAGERQGPDHDDVAGDDLGGAVHV